MNTVVPAVLLGVTPAFDAPHAAGGEGLAAEGATVATGADPTPR